MDVFFNINYIRKKTYRYQCKRFCEKEQTQERDSKPNTIKISSNPRKQNKKISPTKKNFVTIFAASECRIFKRNNELLLLFKKHTDTMIERTKTKPQETLVFSMNKQMQTFSFNQPINLSEEWEWILVVTSFEATNSIFIITNKNNSFSMAIAGHWETQSAEKTNNEINKLLELRSQNGIKLHVEQVKKVIYLTNDHSLYNLGTSKIEIFEEIKKLKKQWSWGSVI